MLVGSSVEKLKKGIERIIESGSEAQIERLEEIISNAMLKRVGVFKESKPIEKAKVTKNVEKKKVKKSK